MTTLPRCNHSSIADRFSGAKRPMAYISPTLIGLGARFRRGASDLERRRRSIPWRPSGATEFSRQQRQNLFGPHRVQIVCQAELLRDDAPRRTWPAAAKSTFQSRPVSIPCKAPDCCDQRLQDHGVAGAKDNAPIVGGSRARTLRSLVLLYPATFAAAAPAPSRCLAFRSRKEMIPGRAP